jgi:hypothetical protein
MEMDDQSGKIYRFQNEEQKECLQERLSHLDHSLTELDKEPDQNCFICKGIGAIKSKPYTKDGHICFYRPCKCTKGRGEQ